MPRRSDRGAPAETPTATTARPVSNPLGPPHSLRRPLLPPRRSLAHLDILMGGRVAEEVIFGRMQVTTGAQSDLQQATSTATAMVTQWGMSDKLGPMFHSGPDLEKLSSTTREAVESEVKGLLLQAEANAKRILTEHKDELHALAKGLLAHETLSKAEINDLLAGKPLKAPPLKAPLAD